MIVGAPSAGRPKDCKARGETTPMKKIIRKRTNANGTSLWSDDRTRVTGLAGGSRAGESCSESRMGVGAFAFWATETFLLKCRIKNNVLVGRIVPSIHSPQPVLEPRGSKDSGATSDAGQVNEVQRLEFS